MPRHRRDLPTPALIVDRPALERNIARMAGYAAQHGAALRPHAKTHKSADIAKLQIAAGAVGLCCAKLGEAEALAAEGIGDIHLTSPVVTPGGIARLVAFATRITLSVIADHPDNVRALEAAAAEAGQPLTLLVDIDPGVRRTGVPSPAAALELARLIGESAHLRFGGVQFYCGSDQHIAAHADRHAAIVARNRALTAALDALAQAGIAVPVVTGGGTGTAMIDADLGVLTEWQAGSYVFLDREYEDCDLSGNGIPAFERALMVDATVISANAEDRVTVDAGLKAFAADAGEPRLIAGAAPGSRYAFAGDEHGWLFPASGIRPALGDRLTFQPPHCDPTVNLYDAFQVIDGDTVEAIWPIHARGRST